MSKFDKVKGFYEAGLWSLAMVRNAVGRWIMAEEFREITGEEYEKE
ncbi:MAG: XkdX family protein [Lacrimispora sp.]